VLNPDFAITASSASNDPVLHFLLFIPSASHTPLKILTSKSDAFLLPQWGGISIYNTPHLASFAHLSDRALHRTFTTFSTQLLTLLGIPELPAGVASQDISPISQWQLDALTRRRVLETAKETQDTLRSFIKLANSIENMPVHADVRDDIEGSLDALEKVSFPPGLCCLAFTDDNG
jgi:phosphatidylinositol glycan class S